MPALLMVAGPIDMFVKFRDGSQRYLGTCKEAPEIEPRPAWIDIKSDVSGRSVPHQKIYDGEQHLLYLNATNRFDWAAYKLMSRAEVPGVAGPGRGVDGPLDRGSLALGSTDYEVTFVYSFGGTAAAPAQMPVGRRYYSCVLLGARESTVGSRLIEVSMVLEANGIYTYANGVRSHRLYTEIADEVLAGLPSIN